jgi:hypothetical protein
VELIEQRKVVYKWKLLELENNKKMFNRASMWILTEQDNNVPDRVKFIEIIGTQHRKRRVQQGFHVKLTVQESNRVYMRNNKNKRYGVYKPDFMF